MSARVQLIGGSFQDAEGTVLANGYLKMKLSQDSVVNNSQICSGVEVQINLDANGSVVTSSPQAVWGNDQLLPINSFYQVTGFTAKGQIAFGPNNQQVIGSGGTFDVSLWIPNQVFNWTPPVSPIVQGTPASAAAPGVTGTILWDSGFIYVCVATNTWKRTAILTW